MSALAYWLASRPGHADGLLTVEVESAAELAELFAAHDYRWPPLEVPPLAVNALPEDLEQLHGDERKRLFLQTLLPLVMAENADIRRERERLQRSFAQGELSADSSTGKWVRRLAARYRVEGDLNAPDFRALLLRRVDEVPVALALAQAANESGWGTSRFAREANNLFGIWTYDASRGIAPRERSADASHYVRVYPDLRSAVQGYIYNLNVSRAYTELRVLRQQQRLTGARLDALELATGLARYSSRGNAYVREIRHMIRGNRLDRIGRATQIRD